jgi:hypothetical protein
MMDCCQVRKVYIVTRGNYFETSICAVFDSPTLAQKYIQAVTGGLREELAVEEWALNPFADQLENGLLPFSLKVNAAGKVVDIRCQDVPFENQDDLASGKDDNLRLKLFARDEEHAKQMAHHMWKSRTAHAEDQDTPQAKQ